MEKNDNKVIINEGNKFNLAELAGSLGDLGTLIPFLIIYIYTIKFDPFGLLLSFGIFNIIIGWYFKTPIPVQPMKAIGTLAVARATEISPSVIWGAGFFIGLFWLFVSFTGLLGFFKRLVNRAVVKGIVLSLGILFMIQSFKMMNSNPYLSLIVIGLALLFSNNKRLPIIFIILLFGICTEAYYHIDKLIALREITPSLQLPRINFTPFNFDQFIQGITILALTQIPLTLGNGIFAVAAENNELFPERQVTPNKIAISTGIMNLLSPLLGGVPMCHGAGGMVGHVRFGARTGGATIILGFILVLLALFFNKSIPLIIKAIPVYILGVMIFLVSLELIKSAIKIQKDKFDISLLLITAILAIWNSGIALLVGIIISKMIDKYRVSKPTQSNSN